MIKFKANEDYTIDYSQGSGGIDIDFQLVHNKSNYFFSHLIYKTTSTGDVEDIGIVHFDFDVEVNEIFRQSQERTFIDPVTYYDHSFSLPNIFKGDLITCIGEVDVKFDVNDIIQNETINFEISIEITIDPSGSSWESELNLIWIEVLLISILIIMIGFIFKIIKIIRYEVTYPVEEKKRDEEFLEFIKKKTKEENQ